MSLSAPPRVVTVALLGNPNTGKSTLFSALCGVRQRVANYPGVTVEKKVGRTEIGGHTLDHANLTTVEKAEAEREVCNDRVNLINQGFQPTDFAYPYGAFNASVKSIVAAFTRRLCEVGYRAADLITEER